MVFGFWLAIIFTFTEIIIWNFAPVFIGGVVGAISSIMNGKGNSWLVWFFVIAISFSLSSWYYDVVDNIYQNIIGAAIASGVIAGAVGKLIGYVFRLEHNEQSESIWWTVALYAFAFLLVAAIAPTFIQEYEDVWRPR